MKVTIRLSTEVSYSVTIPHNSSVEDLRNSAKVACPSFTSLPPDFKLITNGVKLSPYQKLLKDFGLLEDTENTVILMSNGSDTPTQLSPTSTSDEILTSKEVPKKKKKTNKCHFKSCNSPSLRMVGDCSHCQGKFCAKHRLLEDHLCNGLQYCKNNAHERNAMKLQSESTITGKV
ncbi:hypothetical protein HYPBUDRAFT_114151 [Hyphopichia burtonii NRRL Y-1933]|uniref:AN1-type domain-containing protein n=1 Tax=Hyphopichia burtonii NRRL Y-1933 TaxID=984485 RepID=A0A1E4RCN3_9ASCO|nr:hypothetical protein HYPBUDRAFT_114151 [Hyphopichia burtonii NRRL Y-1933]ODV65028.1 hypothetical protein HYPBUDRAFT_114151 [Hyphopichia burtonii NRRL Y-1933]